MMRWMASTARSAESTPIRSAAMASTIVSRMRGSSSQTSMRSRSAAPRVWAGLAASSLIFASARSSLGGGGGRVTVAPGADRNAVASELVVERLRVDTEYARDALLVPAVPLERPKDVVALHFVEREVGPPGALGVVHRPDRRVGLGRL